jgi:hypothetical protein
MPARPKPMGPALLVKCVAPVGPPTRRVGRSDMDEEGVVPLGVVGQRPADPGVEAAGGDPPARDRDAAPGTRPDARR